MSQSKAEFLAKLEAIKTEYATQSLPVQLAEVTTATEVILQLEEGTNAVSELAVMHAAAHKLTGSSGTFGFPEISAITRELTTISNVEGPIGATIDASSQAQIQDMLDRLKNSPEVTNNQQLAEGTETKSNPASEPETALPATLSDNSDDDRVIVLFCEASSPTLAFITEHYSEEFRIIQTSNPSDFFPIAIENQTQVIVADLKLVGDEVESEGIFQDIKSEANWSVSVIFVSEQVDIVARLAAVRAAGDAFIVSPFDEGEFLDTIDRCFDSETTAPFRVLIVDNDQEFTRYVSDILNQSGMVCEIATNASQTLDALSYFVPESVLMDISMPGCHGQELASVILQQEAFVGTPIIFLSIERRREGRLDILRRGAYNFMSKPVDPEMLVGVIREHALRFRALRARMVKDSLTGLINNSMTKRLLEREIDNARRNKLPLSFVILDLDHFKQVNDTHGHSIGDQVLRSLSRLLKQRFRSNDVVGRLGGEEFGVVLAGTSSEVALSIFNDIREEFSGIEFTSPISTFTCTFSAGVAEFGEGQTTAGIFDAADKALYSAKNSGRNQICIES